MAGDQVIRGASPVEYIEEDEFAVEDDGTSSWNWFGLGTSWSVTQGVESENISYLPEYGSSNKLSKRVNIKHSEMWEGEVTYHPQDDFEFLKFFSGEDGGVTDDPPTIQVGEVNEDADPETFRNMLGGMGEEVTVSVDEDGTFEVSGSFIFADGNDWSEDDYVDDSSDGSHADEDTTEPFAYKDLDNVEYGDSDLSGSIESLEFSISNDVSVVKDPSVDRESLIAALVPTDREITASVTLTYENYDLAQEIRSYEAKDLAFDIGSTTFTISDVKFPELNYEFTPDDLVSDSIDSDPATDISWS